MKLQPTTTISLSLMGAALLAAALAGCGGSDVKRPPRGGEGGGGVGGGQNLGGEGGVGGAVLPDAGRDTASPPPDLAVPPPDLAVPPPDTTPDLTPSPDVTPPDTTPTCVAGSACAAAGGGRGLCKSGACVACADPADDAVCAAAYGAGHICIAGSCNPGTCHTSQQCADGKLCDPASHTCVVCPNDAACKADVVHGSQSICLVGKCVTGDCHDRNTDCRAGQICGLSVPHTCAPCTTDAQCNGQFQAGTICVQGACVVGDCRGSSDCTGAKDGLICGARTPNTCGKCTSDSQCQNDTRYRNTRNLCKTTAGANNGECLVNSCTNNGQACAANGADFCCGNRCVPGNCCQDGDCTAMGANFTCSRNTCTQCELATGNAYTVDPVNGSDAAGTGSARAGGAANPRCAFRTITRALRFIGDNPPAGTTITILGVAGQTTDVYSIAAPGSTDPVEANVIEVPENVRITTARGPIRFRLRAGGTAFKFIGPGSSLAPLDAAKLTIDGSGDTSGSGLVVELDSGKVVIANTIVQQTGDDGIRVFKGTADIGPGVRVRDSGTAANAQSGLLVTAGTVNLSGTTSDPVLFDANKENGITVSGTGEVNVDGVAVKTPAPNGNGTVMVKSNARAGVHIAQTATATRINNLRGLVSWGNVAGPGLSILAGSKVQLRNSVLLANGGSGVLITPAAATPAGNDTTGIDLGKAGAAAAGRNVLQARNVAGSNANAESGICVRLSPAMGAHTVSAQGNTFAGPRDCAATNPGPVTKAVDCAMKVDIAAPVVEGTTVTIEVQACTQ